MADLDEVLRKKLLLVTGKGGVGKSFISIQLAKKALQKKKRVLLVEAGSFGILSSLLGLSHAPAEETKVSENLFYINLDSKVCLKEYISDSLDMPRLYQNVFSKSLVQSFLKAIPGLYPVMLLGRLYYSCVRSKIPPFDLVIFDAPASGHYLQLIATPTEVSRSGLVGPLVKEVEKVLHFLRDSKRTGSVVVSLPEDLVIGETLEFLKAGEAVSSVSPCALVLNRVFVDSERQIEEFAARVGATQSLKPLKEYAERRGLRSQVHTKNLIKMFAQSAHAKCGLFGVNELGFVREPVDCEVEFWPLRSQDHRVDNIKSGV